MRAMILAAGLGQRMGPLTATLPKPLLKIKGKYLIEHSIANLKQAGMDEIVINVSYLADQIKLALGNGKRYGVKFFYSEEKERLETGGGIFHALPLLGDPFVVVSSDIITDYCFQNLFQHPVNLAHLIMVKNPQYHDEGDYALHAGRLDREGRAKLTYGNIGIYRAALFANCKPGYFRLTHALNPAIDAGLVTGELYQGLWHNIGTPDDLT